MTTAMHPLHDGAHFSIPPVCTTQQARMFRTSVNQALETGDRRVVIDCEGWALELGMLSSVLQCASRCRDRGVSFELVNLSADLKRNMRELLLDDRLGLRD